MFHRYDAISRMEKAQSAKSGGQSATMDAMMKQMASSAGNSQQATLMAQMMRPMLEKVFGSASTLGSLLASDESHGDRADCSIDVGSSVRDASVLIAKTKRAVLVTEAGEVVGVLTPKDLLTRVVAKDLSPDTTLIGDVMTPNPEVAAPDMSLVDALHTMHTGRFLHLPVVGSDGSVSGVIDVKELVYSTMGACRRNKSLYIERAQ